MGETTKISWADATFNPWWGCRKVSPGCNQCYAQRLSNRFSPNLWRGEHRFFGEKHWNEPLQWDRKAKGEGIRRRVFCGSMCDWAEDLPELVEPRIRLLETIRATPNLDWLLLTKRIENAARLADSWYFWPLENVWNGATIINQEDADRVIRILSRIPAAVRFVSVEPMLAAVYIPSAYLDGVGYGKCGNEIVVPRLNWVIAGAETGPGARPMDPTWARDLRDQCRAAKVPFFMKQMTNKAPIPDDLMIREFPEAAT